MTGTPKKQHYTAIVSFSADAERLNSIVSGVTGAVSEFSDTATEITIIASDEAAGTAS